MSTHAVVHRLAAALVRERRGLGRALVVGMTGPDASGKSQLAEAVRREVEDGGEQVVVVHVDDFHHPRAHRYAGHLPEPDKYLEQSIDVDRLVDEVLAPLRRDGSLHHRLHHLDITADTWTVERRYDVGADTLVLVEGVFLMQPRLRELLDRVVYLDVDDEVLVQRGTLRDREIHGSAAESKFRDKYLPAQRRLRDLHPPETLADVVVDNNDWQSPVLTRWTLS